MTVEPPMMNGNGVVKEVEAQKQTSPLLLSARLTVTILCFFACLITYVLRLNLGFGLVCMLKKKLVSHNQTHIDEACVEFLTYDNETETEDKGEFSWGKDLQGNLLGAFFYGYIITQVPAGWLCDKIGGKKVLGVGLGIVSFLTLAIPEAARVSPFFLMTVRIIQGMFAAVSFPAIHNLVGGWAPPDERGLLMSLAYSGMYFGTVITFPVCGMLCTYGFDGGWPSVFYVTGLAGVLWLIFMFFFVFDGPETHPRISTEEKNYLDKYLEHHHQGNEKSSVPWLSIVTSMPVWAIVVAHLCANWGLYTLAINLPTFMKEVLYFDIKQNGLLSAVPYICTLVVNLFCGKLSDLLRRKEIMTLTTLRKMFNTIGMLIPLACMIIITFLSCQERYLAVATLTICQATSGFAYSGGFFYNHVDIAPPYAGILMGMSNMFATIPGILSPLLIGFLTPNETREEWVVIFYIGAVMYGVGALFYLIFGSGERQPWAAEQPKPDFSESGEPLKPLTPETKIPSPIKI